MKEVVKNETMTVRERRLADTFVSLADTLVREFDVAELFYRLVEISAEIFAADQAGIVIADAGGQLHVVAATSEATHLIEVLQIQNGRGSLPGRIRVRPNGCGFRHR
ncbi:hypothetical protein BH18ACT6_BH18ACT6_02690 [soil metagenome]